MIKKDTFTVYVASGRPERYNRIALHLKHGSVRECKELCLLLKIRNK